jgi:hypothetical protein
MQRQRQSSSLKKNTIEMSNIINYRLCVSYIRIYLYCMYKPSQSKQKQKAKRKKQKYTKLPKKIEKHRKA